MKEGIVKPIFIAGDAHGFWNPLFCGVVLPNVWAPIRATTCRQKLSHSHSIFKHLHDMCMATVSIRESKIIV